MILKMVARKLTLEEQIERAKNGRSQTWIVKQMVAMGFHISDVQFSRKKKGTPDGFKEDELNAISKILQAELIP